MDREEELVAIFLLKLGYYKGLEWIEKKSL
jgi:hypothetical protein